jgi:hypothetical protein
MVATRAQKRSALDSSSPLLRPGILQNVLSYVGPGQHLFVALVSKWWKEINATLETHQLSFKPGSDYTLVVNCTPQITLGSSLFASPARVKVAHDNGLDCTSEEYHLAAGYHAGIASLAMMRKLGIKYIAATMAGAARCNKLAEVQFLHSQGCPWSLYLLEDAATDGYFELVRWCHEQDCG